MRSLYQHATRFDQPTRTHAEHLVAAGAPIRTLPEVLPQLIIVDQALALLPARSGGALIIREPGPSRLPPGRLRTRPRASPTPYATGPHAAQAVSQTMKRTILVMLAKGIKDDTIGRRLGISLRTCRRHVSELLETLGASSRFEAGVIAERQGLTHHSAPPSPPSPAPAPAMEAAPDTARPGPVPSCPVCGGSLPARTPGSTGRPARYCSPKCRSSANRTRKSPEALPEDNTARTSRNPSPA
ncbi:response regulator transcription factor [Streptomyces sp. M-16]|uniref:helix-turn-helix transcriptional regulator n=1 Tax=Streptomyces sp. M-16 TaxID=3233040 RepID=UPI003F9C2699